VNGDIAIQRVFPDDWPLFARARLAALRDAPHAFATKYEAWANAPEDQWRMRLITVPANWVALRGEEALGVIAGSLPEPDRADLMSMWVSPSARGQGVGDQLVTTMLGWARSQPSLKRVELEVYEHNRRAQNLYLRNGFTFTSPETGEPTNERRMTLTV
jgi:ribosomal protein S18 acetylase RimI-like enzyme